MLNAEFLLPKIFCGRSTSVRALGPSNLVRTPAKIAQKRNQVPYPVHSSTKSSTAMYIVKWLGLQTKFSAQVLVHFAFTNTMYLSRL
jgi:hypothetical protein